MPPTRFGHSFGHLQRDALQRLRYTLLKKCTIVRHETLKYIFKICIKVQNTEYRASCLPNNITTALLGW